MTVDTLTDQSNAESERAIHFKGLLAGFILGTECVLSDPATFAVKYSEKLLKMTDELAALAKKIAAIPE